MPAGDPAALEAAHQAWEGDAVEAERLGEVDLRARLENAALTILDPDTFERIGHDLAELVASRAGWLEATADAITAALAADGVDVVAIQHRAKHTAGVWRKMQEKRLNLDEVHDILAFRIIVAGHDDCYLALNTIHRLFEPEPFRFKDYIAEPKTNGYRSLHTSISDRDGLVFEVQIRTAEMHRAAENGDSAHWRYHADRTSQARLHGRAGRRRRPRAV
jgi:GTP pyrophosphokinase